MEFDHDQLRKATSNFLETRENGKIGEGGFGPVFVADLYFTKVAIKLLRLKNQDEFNVKMANDQFKTEVEVLTKYRHPNLVTLMGYSKPRDGGCPCLVYEFMTNGNLEEAISPQRPAHSQLNYRIRLDITMDAARALVYLHRAIKNEPLVHRDVKSANILLDTQYNAKVGDFGLARAIGRDGHGGKTTKVMGTSGYIAPEYLHGDISEKIDVYAFGVVLFEVLTSLPSFDNSRQRGPSLVTFLQEKVADLKDVWRAHRDEEVAKWPAEAARALSSLATCCLEPNPRHRPNMNQVLLILKDIKMAQVGQPVESQTLAELFSRQPVVPPSGSISDRPLAIAEKATEPVLTPMTPDMARPFQEESTGDSYAMPEMVYSRQREHHAFSRSTVPAPASLSTLPSSVEEESFSNGYGQPNIRQPASAKLMAVSEGEAVHEKYAVQESQQESNSSGSRNSSQASSSYGRPALADGQASLLANPLPVPFLMSRGGDRRSAAELWAAKGASVPESYRHRTYHDSQSTLPGENPGQPMVESLRRSPNYLSQGAVHNGESQVIIAQPVDDQPDSNPARRSA